MYFSHPSPYELGGSPDIEIEDAALAKLGIEPRTDKQIGLIRLDGTDPIDMEGMSRTVRGFSLTCTSYEYIPEGLTNELSYAVTGGRAAELEEFLGVKLGIGSRGL